MQKPDLHKPWGGGTVHPVLKRFSMTTSTKALQRGYSLRRPMAMQRQNHVMIQLLSWRQQPKISANRTRTSPKSYSIVRRLKVMMTLITRTLADTISMSQTQASPESYSTLRRLKVMKTLNTETAAKLGSMNKTPTSPRNYSTLRGLMVTKTLSTRHWQNKRTDHVVDKY